MADRVVLWGISAFFTGWAVATLLVYIPRYTLFIRAVDVLLIVPEWRFFGPIPGRSDMHLLFRDRLDDGAIDEWREIDIVSMRPLWSALWNPRRREAKALFDACVEMAKARVKTPDAVLGSMPYLTLINFVSAQPRWTRSVETQFLIMMRDADATPPELTPVFLSEFHAL
jgi:hypothetical protein